MIEFVNQEGDDVDEEWKGYFYAAVLLLQAVVSTTFLHNYFMILNTTAIQVRSSIISVVFNKALHLSSKMRNTFTLGEITNYISVDAQKVLETLPFTAILWSTPYTVAVTIYFLYQVFLTINCHY